MDIFRDIFGYRTKEPLAKVKLVSTVVKESPIEYKTVVCDHIWEDPIILHLSPRIHSDDYNQFLDLIKYKHTDYNDITILKFRCCSKCHQIEIKSDYEGLYGPREWTPINDILSNLVMTHSTNITGIPEPKDIYEVLQLNDRKFRNSGKKDNSNRLHCDDGPAVFRPSGIPEYWWHGVNIPEIWIEEKDTLNSEDFLKEQNAERRKALMEIIGTEKFISVLQMTKISDILRNNILYELFEKTDQTFGKIHLVRCTNPPKIPNDSPLIYYLLTPPWISDVWESVAWTFYERADTYNPEVET